MTDSRVPSKQGIALLTGATGYLGGRLLPRLVASGRKVRCLVLPSDEKDPSKLCPCEVLRSDLSDSKGLDSIMDGVDTVLHLAALMPPNDAEQIRKVNVGGTAALLEKARAKGVRRFVYLSAVSATYPIKNAYGQSKAEAEALVAASGLDFTILRPTMIYGEGGGLHFAKLVGLLEKIPLVFPVLGPGRARLQPVYVDDAARAVEIALASPAAAGRTLNVSGGSVVTFNELVDAVASAMGRRRIRLHAPLWLCRIAAAAAERIKPGSFLSRDAIVGLTQDATLDHSELLHEFGWKPLDLESGLALYFGSPADKDASREAA
ncbi:MAG TPA: NAD-dependent epimerase/dehydratase family protein [Thermoanaerobaculia bacterium]